MGCWVSEDNPFGHIFNELLDLLISEGEDEGIEERGHHGSHQDPHLAEVCGVALAWPYIDKDGPATVQDHQGKVGDAGREGLPPLGGAWRTRAGAAQQAQ